jgi:hypothetical protein
VKPRLGAVAVSFAAAAGFGLTRRIERTTIVA